LIRLLALLAIIGTILLVFMSAYSTSNIFSLVSKLYEDVLFARGPGSFTDRSAVYVYTLQGALERPLLGWGTERDIPNFPYPAGSHSHYLGILYKQGFIGFLVFLATLFTLWKETSVPKLSRTATSVQRTLVKFLQFGRWTMVTALFNRASDVLDLDATTMMFLWTIFALLIQARSLIFSPDEKQEKYIANVPE
jgi:O-antigen ligase